MKKSFLLIVVSIFVNIFSLQAQMLSQGMLDDKNSWSLKVDNENLKGTLLAPSNDSNDKVVIFISGSGPTDRDGNNSRMKNNSIKFLAESLEKANIPSFRFDKRSIGHSSRNTKEKDLRFETYINDLKHWIDTLSYHYKTIILAGHSEGSLLGMAAAVNNSKVKGYISIAGVALSIDVILMRQLKTKLLPSQIETVNLILQDVKKGVWHETVPTYIQSVLRPSVQPYMKSHIAYNPQELITELRIPALIIQGNSDIQVDVDQAEILHKAYPKSKLVIVDGMNHVLKYCPTLDFNSQIKTYTDPTAPIVKQLSTEIIRFVNGI